MKKTYIVEFPNGVITERIVVHARSHEEAYYEALRVAGAKDEPEAKIWEAIDQ